MIKKVWNHLVQGYDTVKPTGKVRALRSFPWKDEYKPTYNRFANGTWELGVFESDAKYNTKIFGKRVNEQWNAIQTRKTSQDTPTSISTPRKIKKKKKK